jgi:hypothetical protein
MIVLGGMDDQTSLLVWSTISKGIFSIGDPILGSYPVYKAIFSLFSSPFSTPQPLLWSLVSIGLSIFGYAFLNALFVFAVLLTLVFSYLLFKKSPYALLYGLVFTFSSYTWIHLGLHIDLIQIWFIPLFLYVLRRLEEKRSLLGYIKLGVVLALVLPTSNYLWFMLCALYSFYILADILVNLSLKSVVFNIKRFLITLSISLLFVGIMIFIPKGSSSASAIPLGGRPYEDFVTFSSRPWYHFVPSEKNPLLGSVATLLNNKIGEWDYFLADDYFSGEHLAAFYGYSFLVYLAVSLFVYFRKVKFGLNTKEVYKFLIMSAFLFLIMFPPFFTIRGLKIFMPAELLYKFFPMFRVTSRFSIMLLMSLLLAVYKMEGLVLKEIPRLKKIFILLFGLTLLEVFVPPKVVNYSDPPEEYTRLREVTSEGSVFAVYPYSQTQEALFWLSEHKRLLANPRSYRNRQTGYYSKDFTDSLVTAEAKDALEELDVKYVMVFSDAKDEDKEYFRSQTYLTPISWDSEVTIYEVFQ